MSRDRYKKKLQYFLDYYLVKTVAICFGIFVVALFLVHYFRPAPETILYVAVYDLTLDGEEKDTLCRELAAAYEEGAEASQVIIDDSFRSDSAKDVERLQVLAANHAVDVIICPQREIMEAYAGYGYLRELPALLSKEAEDRAREEKRLIRAAGMLWTDEISFEDHESGQGPEKPYVMDISRTGRWERLAGTGTPGFLGTVLDTPHEKTVTELIAVLMER
jgi:hypothetical protein